MFAKIAQMLAVLLFVAYGALGCGKITVDVSDVPRLASQPRKGEPLIRLNAPADCAGSRWSLAGKPIRLEFAHNEEGFFTPELQDALTQRGATVVRGGPSPYVMKVVTETEGPRLVVMVMVIAQGGGVVTQSSVAGTMYAPWRGIYGGYKKDVIKGVIPAMLNGLCVGQAVASEAPGTGPAASAAQPRACSRVPWAGRRVAVVLSHTRHAALMREFFERHVLAHAGKVLDMPELNRLLGLGYSQGDRDARKYPYTEMRVDTSGSGDRLELAIRVVDATPMNDRKGKFQSWSRQTIATGSSYARPETDRYARRFHGSGRNDDVGIMYQVAGAALAQLCAGTQ